MAAALPTTLAEITPRERHRRRQAGKFPDPCSGNYTITFNTPGSTYATLPTNNGAASNYQVIITSTLGGGNIVNQFQNPINYNTAPQLITATAATGGSCGGAYAFQWYSSPDESTWTLIGGATGQNYQPGLLTALTYFKREVICSLNGSPNNNTAYWRRYHQRTLRYNPL